MDIVLKRFSAVELIKKIASLWECIISFNTNPFSSLGKILLLPVFLLIATTVLAQKAVVEGKIIASQNVDVEGINIFNLSTKKGVISDQNGNFQIAVSLNDSISISALHIQENVVVIGEDQLKSKKLLIDISEKETLLNPVTLRKPLTGYLGMDANTIPLKEIITATSTGLPNPDIPPLPKSERMLYTASSGPIDLLVNTLTGERKRIKKRIELEKKSNITETLLDRFPMTYFVDALSIPQFKVYEFFFFCEDDPEYTNILKRPHGEVIAFLKIKSDQFLKSIAKKEED